MNDHADCDEDDEFIYHAAWCPTSLAEEPYTGQVIEKKEKNNDNSTAK